MTGEGTSNHSADGWGMADVLHPLGVTDFLDASWGKSYRVIRGTPRKFDWLLNWGEIETLLECGFPLENLNVVKNGEFLPDKRYLFYPATEPQGVVNGQGLYSQLSGGATLVLNSVDRHLPRIRQLTSNVANEFQANACINLYAGWRTQRGFTLHWDPQETLLMQIEGRKAWQVFAPTRPHPLKTDREEPNEPQGVPVWEGVLEAGDVLYMPRGWWHVPTPMNERSVHLTLTIVPTSGPDLLHWLFREMLEHPELRANTPRLTSMQEQQAYLARLRDLFAAGITDDLLERFYRHWDASAEVRSQICLPGPTSHPAPLADKTRLRLTVGRCLDLRPSQASGQCTVSAGGHSWHCSAEFEPALRLLNNITAVSLETLHGALPEQSAKAGLNVFLSILILGGAVFVDDDGLHP